MRFGLNTFLYASPFTNESVSMFKKLKKWGFDTVEIAIEDPSHVDPAVLKAAAAKAGLAIGSVCAAMGPGRDFRGSAADQKNAQKYLTALVDQAAAMGCPRIIGPLYSVVGLIGSHDDKTKAAHFKLVVKNLKQLAKHAEKKGVLLCVEPLNRFETDFLNTCDQGLRLVKAVNSPAVKLHLDTFHMNIEEKNQAAAILKAGKHLGHFHACGTDRGVPGGDSLDWKPIVAALKKIGYKQDVVIESFTTDVKVIARAAAIWRKIEPKRDDIAVVGLKNLRKLFG
ncbi:MAG: sugar phosphate isomerase/epimerase family protein, partial [Opitutia bacterium]